MEESKRTMKSKEERIAEINATIKYHKHCIDKLELRKSKINNPVRSRSKGLKRVINESGLSEAALAAALGFDDPDQLKEVIANASKSVEV